jgi:hypothetical protein
MALDHGAFVGIVTTSSSETLSLKTDLLSRLMFWAFAYAFFGFFFQERRWHKDHYQHSPL